jgi:hypothetical protein
VKVEGASAQGRPPLWWIEVRLRVDHNHAVNNGINNNAGAAILKPQVLNF